MKYVYIVEAIWEEKVNHEEEGLPGWIPDWKIIAQDNRNRIFLNEEDARGYCNLMNNCNEYENGNKRNSYHYWKEKICETKYGKYA